MTGPAFGEMDGLVDRWRFICGEPPNRTAQLAERFNRLICSYHPSTSWCGGSVLAQAAPATVLAQAAPAQTAAIAGLQRAIEMARADAERARRERQSDKLIEVGLGLLAGAPPIRIGRSA